MLKNKGYKSKLILVCCMKRMLFLVFLLGSLLFLLSACKQSVVSTNSQVEGLEVSGSSIISAAPDVAHVQFTVETRSLNVRDAQVQNRKISDDVSSALKNAGIRKQDVETSGYNIEILREWDESLSKTVEKGYHVVNSFDVKTSELDRVGEFVDVAVNAGITGVSGISFELSDEISYNLRLEALQKATEDANKKAKALASGANVRLGKVLRVSETSYNVLPYRSYAKEVASFDSGAPPTELFPKGVQVSAQVSAVYEIG